MKEKIIVALDAMTREQALGVARELSGHVWGFKINDLTHRVDNIGTDGVILVS